MKPKPGDKIQYTGYVMHNGSFYGFINEYFEVLNPGREFSTRGIIWVRTAYRDENWEGWIPHLAYKNQERPVKEGIIDVANDVLIATSPSWKRVLSSKGKDV